MKSILMMALVLVAFTNVAHASDIKSACESSLRKKKKKVPNASAVCECIDRGIKKKKFKPEELSLLLRNYQGKLNMKAEQKKNPELVDPLFEFDQDLAESCLEDPKFEIEAE